MMDEELRATVQQRVSGLGVLWFDSLHADPSIPEDFRPWTCGLSPSAMYGCSLKCRKSAGIKPAEAKWMSIKRWVTTTPDGVDLPPGVFYSIKRSERFDAFPSPHFEKTEYVVLMFPFGNVWSQSAPGVPITDEWMWTVLDGVTMFERLLRKDAAFPLPEYFRKVHDYMLTNPDQIGIHLKRKRRQDEPEESGDLDDVDLGAHDAVRLTGER